MEKWSEPYSGTKYEKSTFQGLTFFDLTNNKLIISEVSSVSDSTALTISWVGPMLAGIVVSFLLYAMQKFSKTANNTLSGTIRLETVSRDVDDLKQNLNNNIDNLRADFSKGLERIEHMIQQNEKENRANMTLIWKRMDELTTQITLSNYRIEQLEKDRNRSISSNGKGAV